MQERTRGRGANVRIDSALHIGDAPDALLGARGALGEGARPLLYAWCERERLYHYTSARRGAHNAVHPGTWTERVAQPKRPVLTYGGTSVSARVFAERYDAQRLDRAPMLRGAGSVALRTVRPVALTLGARHALARVNAWSTPEGNAQRTADWNALRARIDARES